jgi:hypothetical protein
MKISEETLKNKGITYNQKYPYGELARVTKDRKRHYETPDGRQVPSVTTVLSATKDMTHLHAWRKRIGVEKAQQITTESANIGTVMHRSLEKHVKGEDRTPGSNLIQQKAHAMANVIIDNGLNNVYGGMGIRGFTVLPRTVRGHHGPSGSVQGSTGHNGFQTGTQIEEEGMGRGLLPTTCGLRGSP